MTDSSKLKNYYFWIDKVNTRNYICTIMYLILSKQKLNKNVLVDISEPHFFQSWTNRGSPAVVAEAAKERESESSTSSRSSRTSCPSIGNESWRTKKKKILLQKKSECTRGYSIPLSAIRRVGGYRPKNLLSVMGKCLEFFCTDGRFHEIARGGCHSAGHLAFVWGRVIIDEFFSNRAKSTLIPFWLIPILFCVWRDNKNGTTTK